MDAAVAGGCASNDAMDDIEDMKAPGDTTRPPRGVARRVRRAKEEVAGPEVVEVPDPTSVVPGVQSVYVKTYGCSHNHSDSEYMCGLLAQYGYSLVGEAQRQDADLWLINTCTVKNPSQEHMQTDIGRGQALGKPVVVAGCVSQGDPELKFLTGLSIVGVQQLERVVEVVQETLKGGALSGKQPPGGFLQCALQHAPARARAIASSGQPPRLRRLVRAGDAGNAGNA